MAEEKQQTIEATPESHGTSPADIQSGFVKDTHGRIFWRDVDHSSGRARTMGLSRYGVWNLPQSDRHDRAFVPASTAEIEVFRDEVLRCQLLEERALLQKIDQVAASATVWNERFKSAL